MQMSGDYLARRAGGNPDPPVKQRAFWTVMEGVVAAVLLLGGGLVALRTASISSGVRFAVVPLLMCGSLSIGLRNEWARHLFNKEH